MQITLNDYMQISRGEGLPYKKDGGALRTF